MKILNNFEFYICDRKECVPCSPSCLYTMNKKHAVDPNKPLNFGDDVVAIVLEETAGADNG